MQSADRPTANLTHAELGRALHALRLGVGASDLHGSLTGYLCGGGAAGADDWLSALELDAGEPAAGRHDVLRRLYRHCREQLDDPELGFEPLLPAPDVALDARAEALVEWCRGFIGGIGLAGAGTKGIRISPDADEILHDFGGIAGTRFEYGNSEEDESALAEVLEFVRVGVLLLYGEFTDHPRQRRATLH